MPLRKDRSFLMEVSKSVRSWPIRNHADGEADTDAACFRLLGVRVDAIQIPEVVIRMERWISEHTGCHFVAVTGMHGVVEARHDPFFRQVLMWADLVVPDGMPLVWIGRRKGYALKHRVCGPELMLTFCRSTGPKYRHFFYGGAPGVPDRLAEILQRRYGIRVAGTHSPPFRPPTTRERRNIIARIQESRTDVLWVGLGTPKQELWMYEHRDTLAVPVMVGVGAAFDINSGRVKRAPVWMRDCGLEWLFRLLQEPRRLSRRYLIYGPEFAWKVSLEVLGLKEF